MNDFCEWCQSVSVGLLAGLVSGLLLIHEQRRLNRKDKDDGLLRQIWYYLQEIGGLEKLKEENPMAIIYEQKNYDTTYNRL
jgi:hypothetical protein